MAESVAEACYAPSEPDLDNPSEGKRCIQRRSTPPFSPLETIHKELLDLLDPVPVGSESIYPAGKRLN